MTNETFDPANANEASNPPPAKPSRRRKLLLVLIPVVIVPIVIVVAVTLANSRKSRERARQANAAWRANQPIPLRLVNGPFQYQRYADDAGQGHRDQRPGNPPRPNENPVAFEFERGGQPGAPAFLPPGANPQGPYPTGGGRPNGTPPGADPYGGHGGPRSHHSNPANDGNGHGGGQPPVGTQFHGQPTVVFAPMRPSSFGSPGQNGPNPNTPFMQPPETHQQAVGVATTSFSGFFTPGYPFSVPATEADRRAAELAARLRQSGDESQKETLHKELTDVLGQAFEQRRQQQQSEIQRLERQLESIRQLDKKRQERKSEIVQKRLAELIGEPDTLAWDVTTPSPTNGQPSAPGPRGPSPQPPPHFGPTDTQRPTGMAPGQPYSDPYPFVPQMTPPEMPPTGPGAIGIPAPPVVGRPLLPSAADNRRTAGVQPDRVPTAGPGAGRLATQPAQPFARFEMPPRILDLTDEIRRHRQLSAALLRIPAENRPPGLHNAQANERLARAKLALAESEWKNIGSQLRAQADEADQRLESAQQRSPETLQPGFAPWEDVLQSLRSEAKTLRQNYEAWSRTDQVLRSVIDDLSEPDQANASQRLEAPTQADNVSPTAENALPEETTPAEQTTPPQPGNPDSAAAPSPETGLEPAEMPQASGTPAD